MKLPNAENARVDIRKLTEYCLSSEHPKGKHKARVFLSALGITLDNAESLQAALLGAAINGDAILGERDEYGQRYVLDFEMTSSTGTATIRSAWIVKIGEEFPRLITCYVKDE